MSTFDLDSPLYPSIRNIDRDACRTREARLFRAKGKSLERKIGCCLGLEDDGGNFRRAEDREEETEGSRQGGNLSVLICCRDRGIEAGALSLPLARAIPSCALSFRLPPPLPSSASPPSYRIFYEFHFELGTTLCR